MVKSAGKVVSLEMSREELNHQLCKRGETKSLESQKVTWITTLIFKLCVYQVQIQLSTHSLTYALVWAPVLVVGRILSQGECQK